jgi:Tol biopolymer transport system component
MNSDGSNVVRLTTNTASDSDPNWSPDGTKLAFVSDRSGNFEIYSMNADGSNVTQLTPNRAYDADPAWSPDGSMITFTTNRNGLNEIAVMNADGTRKTVISNGPDGFPDWQPVVPRGGR